MNNICIGTSTTRLSEGVSGTWPTRSTTALQYFGIGIYHHLSIFFPTKSICSGSSVYGWFQSLILSLTQKGSAPHFHVLLHVGSAPMCIIKTVFQGPTVICDAVG